MKEPDSTSPPFLNGDPAAVGFQFLENIATGYWYSQTLFTAIEIDLFSQLAGGSLKVHELAEATGCRRDELERLLRVLERMKLLVRHEDQWSNSLLAARHLVRGTAEFMGDFFLYRQFMQANWLNLTEQVRGRSETPAELDYNERNFRYVRAMDSLVQRKAAEITEYFPIANLRGPFLDVGGGAGSLLRAIRSRYLEKSRGGWAFAGELFDLEEVIEAARRLYPESEDWQDIATTSGDFRTHDFKTRYGGIILSNFLHAYGAEEAAQLLVKAVNLVAEGGFILIHDYFPDRSSVVVEKGALYDICMMLNTYNGACHETEDIRGWLQESEKGAGLQVSVRDLATDSALMLIGGPEEWHRSRLPWVSIARDLGFDRIAPISPQQVITAPWVLKKCRYGCGGYGGNLQCPPHTDSHVETRNLLDCYSAALLVQGQPPGKAFHHQLLELERQTFLRGYHKALVYGAGPCPLCQACPEDGTCRSPAQARPSMEACGIDVYETVRSVGWELEVVPDKAGFVKYFGLLLVE